MIVQGLGPGLRTVATRRSVIFKVEGLELVLAVLKGGSGAALARAPNTAPPNRAADVLRSSRRPMRVRSCFGMCCGLLQIHHYNARRGLPSLRASQGTATSHQVRMDLDYPLRPLRPPLSRACPAAPAWPAPLVNYAAGQL